MNDIELSCGLPPGPDFAELARLAEELGYARVWVFDSAPFWEDSFVRLALGRDPYHSHRAEHRRALIPTQRSVMTMASALSRRSAGCRAAGCGPRSAPASRHDSRLASAP